MDIKETIKERAARERKAKEAFRIKIEKEQAEKEEKERLKREKEQAEREIMRIKEEAYKQSDEYKEKKKEEYRQYLINAEELYRRDCEKVRKYLAERKISFNDIKNNITLNDYRKLPSWINWQFNLVNMVPLEQIENMKYKCFLIHGLKITDKYNAMYTFGPRLEIVDSKRGHNSIDDLEWAYESNKDIGGTKIYYHTSHDGPTEPRFMGYIGGCKYEFIK